MQWFTSETRQEAAQVLKHAVQTPLIRPILHYSIIVHPLVFCCMHHLLTSDQKLPAFRPQAAAVTPSDIMEPNTTTCKVDMSLLYTVPVHIYIYNLQAYLYIMAELTWQRVLWFLFVMVHVFIKNTSITIVLLNFFRLIIYELRQLLTRRHTLPLTNTQDPLPLFHELPEFKRDKTLRQRPGSVPPGKGHDRQAWDEKVLQSARTLSGPGPVDERSWFNLYLGWQKSSYFPDLLESRAHHVGVAFWKVVYDGCYSWSCVMTRDAIS